MAPAASLTPAPCVRCAELNCRHGAAHRLHRCSTSTPLTASLPPLQGVLEEVGLIRWPAPLKAVVQTLLVIVIVAGTSAGLLAVNGLLTELGKLY